jgi:hypothetical protein
MDHYENFISNLVEWVGSHKLRELTCVDGVNICQAKIRTNQSDKVEDMVLAFDSQAGVVIGYQMFMIPCSKIKQD